MTGELVLPDPEPVAETEPAHTCAGWIRIPKGTRPTCGRCSDRLEAYRLRAAGHGTVEEVREAIGALENVRGQPPLGECVRIRFEGVTVWACPRSMNVGTDDDPTPLVAAAPNRAQRRRQKIGRP